MIPNQEPAQEHSQLISQLEQFDNKHGYRMDYKEVSRQLKPIVEAIVMQCEKLLPELHDLIKYEETWSCLFALEALNKIKNPNSVPYLIELINRVDDGDYYEAGEEAMFALNAIGTPAVEPLMRAVQEMFEKKKCDSYVIGALTEIKDERVYRYMVSVLENYEKNPKKYAEWFEVYVWCWDFVKQENKEVLPLLRRIISMPQITKQEQIEIRDTIEFLDNPEEWHRQTDKIIKEMKKKIGRNDPSSC